MKSPSHGERKSSSLTKIIKSHTVSVNAAKPYVLDLNPGPGDVKPAVKDRKQAADNEVAQEVSRAAYLARVKLDAAQILEEARAQAEELKRKAWEQGYAEGQTEAKTELEKRINEINKQIDCVFKNFQTHFETLSEEMTHCICDLGFAIAQKIISTELSRDGQAIKAIVQNALLRMETVPHACVHLSSRDYDLFEQTGLALLSDERLSWIRDENLPIGSCLVTSDYGTIDASVKTQLIRIKAALEEESR